MHWTDLSSIDSVRVAIFGLLTVLVAIELWLGVKELRRRARRLREWQERQLAAHSVEVETTDDGAGYRVVD